MLFKKLSALFVLAFSIILIFTMLCVFQLNNTLVREHMYETHYQSVSSASAEIDNSFRQVRSVLLEACVDDSIQKSLSAFCDDLTDQKEPAEVISKTFSEALSEELPEALSASGVPEGSAGLQDTGSVIHLSDGLSSGIDEAFKRYNGRLSGGFISFYAVTPDGYTYKLSADGSYMYDTLYTEEYFKGAMSEPKSFAWNLMLNSSGPRIILSKVIYDAGNADRIIGYADINLSLSGYTRIMNAVNTGNSGTVFLLDADNSIIYPALNRSFDLEKTVYNGEIKDFTDLTGLSGLISSKEYEMVFIEPLMNGWQLAVQVKDPQSTELNIRLRENIITGGLIILIIAACTTLFISYHAARPLTQLAGQIRKMDVNAPALTEPEPGYKDETKLLFDSFNELIRTRDELKQSVYDMSIREKEAELRSLQAQINPHFLYNTLDSINWMAMKYDADDISEIVVALSKMLRFSLNNGINIIPLRNELEQIKGYIYIQQIRFKDLFNAEFKVDEDLLDTPVIKLILQPLVENAIIHGFEGIDSFTGLLTIDIHKEADRICFSVSNNGNLMDTDKMYSRLHPASDEEVKSYGLKNVNDRLIKHYGPEAALSFRVENGISYAEFSIGCASITA